MESKYQVNKAFVVLKVQLLVIISESKHDIDRK